MMYTSNNRSSTYEWLTMYERMSVNWYFTLLLLIGIIMRILNLMTISSKKNLYKNYLLFVRIFQLLLLNWFWWDDMKTLEKEHIETNRSRHNDHKHISHYHTWHLLCVKYFLSQIKMCVHASVSLFDFSFCIFWYLYTLKF